MARKSKEWEEGLAKDLKDPTFVIDFIRAALDEGIPLQQVLAKVIKCLGIKEFSKKAKMASPNIIRILNLRYNPTQSSLNRLLKPLGLRLTVGPISNTIKKKAA